MFGKVMDALGKRAHRREVEDFLARIRSMDSSEVGIPAALTYEWASALGAEHSWDLFNSWEVISNDIEAPIKIGTIVRSLQNEGPVGQLKATGLLVWAHTLRATVNLDIRPQVREIWSNLARGFPHAEDASFQIYSMTGTMCDLSRLGDFPAGFGPNKS